MNNNVQISRLVDIDQLAELWRVSPHTIRSFVRQNRLRPTRVCRRLLFSPEECERLLHSHDDQSDKSVTTRQRAEAKHE